MRAVALRAMLYGFRGDEMRDAVQSGAVGLIRAVDRFDPDRGARLGTYAWHWIGSAMRQSRSRQETQQVVEPARSEVAERRRRSAVGLPEELAEVLRFRYGLGARDALPMTPASDAQRLG